MSKNISGYRHYLWQILFFDFVAPKIHKEKVITFIAVIRILKYLLPLFVVQFFTWLALFALWIYATPFITRYIFNSTDAESQAFENGITRVGVCFAF